MNRKHRYVRPVMSNVVVTDIRIHVNASKQRDVTFLNLGVVAVDPGQLQILNFCIRPCHSIRCREVLLIGEKLRKTTSLLRPTLAS